ncbi:MAG: aspartate carbamoyltransferase [Legionellales bacterium RIFCSPHIGHO2_12_FULL_37_14]|nr:MAG: aspartate carbamoyltransferase [Legionellales bacterium RIFCSPHIGHO2_12_FULL_37_14]
MKHLTSIDDLSLQELKNLFQRANELKLAPNSYPNLAQHKACALFYENSTRTYMSFNLAAQNCKLPLIPLPMQHSSERKGESFLDSLLTINAMGIRLFIIRHNKTQAFSQVLNNLPPTLKIINAGDGQNEHPSQALLDMMTIMGHFSKVEKLKIALIGDIRHSRVANSLLKLCNKLGINNITCIAPKIWHPQDLSFAKITEDPALGLDEADVIITLRIQEERLALDEKYDLKRYQEIYGLTKDRLKLANKNAIILHPGPINRNVEITTDLADCAQSCILEQVRNGVFMRMAIIEALLT